MKEDESKDESNEAEAKGDYHSPSLLLPVTHSLLSTVHLSIGYFSDVEETEEVKDEDKSTSETKDDEKAE